MLQWNARLAALLAALGTVASTLGHFSQSWQW